jgi:hypothetical protein
MTYPNCKRASMLLSIGTTAAVVLMEHRDLRERTATWQDPKDRRDLKV